MFERRHAVQQLFVNFEQAAAKAFFPVRREREPTSGMQPSTKETT
jgi:hypothetical protein